MKRLCSTPPPDRVGQLSQLAPGPSCCEGTGYVWGIDKWEYCWCKLGKLREAEEEEQENAFRERGKDYEPED